MYLTQKVQTGEFYGLE